MYWEDLKEKAKDGKIAGEWESKRSEFYREKILGNIYKGNIEK